jgi:transposase
VQASGRSRSGRTTKIHALIDAEGRTRLLLLSPGNAHDVVMAPTLITAAGSISKLIADEADDTNPLRARLAEKGIEPVIPSIWRRKPSIPYDVRAYRHPNLIERVFRRLKDFRRMVAQLSPDPSPCSVSPTAP